MARIVYGQFPVVTNEVTPQAFNELTRILTQVLLQLDTDAFRIGTKITPASASDVGRIGDIVYDNDYVYICIDTDTWKRAALSTW